MKRIILGCSVLMGLVIALVIARPGETPGGTDDEAMDEDRVTRVVLSGSLAVSFDNVPDLADESTLIVIGKVVDSSPYTEQPNPGVDLTVFVTVYEFQIEEVLKGVISDSTIPVIQRGGRLGRVIQEFWDDPLYEVGQTYLLFLRFRPSVGRYSTVSAHQGRFVVEDGKVSSLSVVYPDRVSYDIRIEDMPLSDFKALIGQ